MLFTKNELVVLRGASVVGGLRVGVCVCGCGCVGVSPAVSTAASRLCAIHLGWWYGWMSWLFSVLSFLAGIVG